MPRFAVRYLIVEWQAWDIMFYSSGGFAILANVIFLLFASAERQEFDLTREEKERRLSRASANSRYQTVN